MPACCWLCRAGEARCTCLAARPYRRCANARARSASRAGTRASALGNRRCNAGIRLVENQTRAAAGARAERAFGLLVQGRDRLYGFVSHPIPFRAGKRVAVRVVSQFGEESTKVLSLV